MTPCFLQGLARSLSQFADEVADVVAPKEVGDHDVLRIDDAAAARAFLERFDNFVCDCDGVLWRGGKVLDGVPETLALLRRLGKTVVFVTNNSTKSRVQYKEKLLKLGLVDADFPAARIVTSGSAAAAFVAQHHPGVRKVFAIGEAGMFDELRGVGLTLASVPDDAPARLGEEEFEGVAPDADVGAVVVGWDRGFSFRKLCLASLYVQRGAALVATNPDAADALADRTVPGNGALVAAVERATGATAAVAGKPSGALLTHLCRELGLERGATCMVGDRLDTDILFGHNGGLAATALVLTGTTDEEGLAAVCRDCARRLGEGATAAERARQSRAFKLKPEFVLPSFGALAAGPRQRRGCGGPPRAGAATTAHRRGR